MDGPELWRRLDRLGATLASAASQLEELREGLADLNLPGKPLPECPRCGPIRLPRDVTIADHLRNVHGVDS